MTINFGGNVYDDAGSAVSGASVKLLETGTTTQEGSTVTTDSAGRWDFTEADQDRYDVEITKGSSVRRIKWSDEISLQEIDVRNNTGATTPAATFTNLTNNAANQVAVFSGANSTKADDDEIYLSFKLADSAGNIDEFARMTVVATDVTSGSEDGQVEFDVMKGGSLIKAFTISSSDAGAQSIDFNQDSITFGTGTAATDITLTFDAESADGVITWMEDEDYFKFSDDILMNSTEKIQFYDTAIYIYSSADGQLDLVADTEIQIAATTIDIDGAVAFNGALTGITNITLSGTLSDGNYTFDTSGNVSGLGTVASGAITSSGIIKTDNATEATSTTDGSLQTDGGLSVVKDAVFGDDVFLLSDSSVFNMGAGSDFTITHDGTTGATLAGNPITITSAAASTWSTSSGALTITSGAALNLNPTSGSAILLDGTISVDAGVVTGATAITSATIDATTDFTIGDTVITDGVITDSSGLQLVANLDIDGTADISGDLTLSGGADGALQFTNAGENSIKIPDNQASALIIEEANNAYITFVTTNSSEAITVAKATTFSAGIANSGTIAAGTWNGTAIASGYIAADAITGAKIADDAVDSEHYTDGSIDNAHIADDAIDSEHYADGSIDNAHIADDAIDSEHYADGSIDTAHIADNQITLAKMAGGTDGQIITYDASGDPVAVGPGTDGQVLTSTGAGSPPAFEDASGGTGALTRVGGNTTEATTTSTSAVDLLSVSSLSIGVASPIMLMVSGRKTAGAADDVAMGLKLNSTILGEASTNTAAIWGGTTNDRIESGLVWIMIPPRSSAYPRAILGIRETYAADATGVTGTVNVCRDNDIPTATITDVVIRGITDNSSNTLAADELHVYTLADS